MRDDEIDKRFAEHDRKLERLSRRVESTRDYVDDILTAVRVLADAANIHIQVGRRPRARRTVA